MAEVLFQTGGSLECQGTLDTHLLVRACGCCLALEFSRMFAVCGYFRYGEDASQDVSELDASR